MTLLRAPSQYAPGRAGGPVTPSCCGCCCCCCCAGTALATTIALPLLLHQLTRSSSEAEQSADADRTAPGAPSPGSVTSDPAASRAPGTDAGRSASSSGRGRRVLGIVMAASAVPVGVGAFAGGTLLGDLVAADGIAFVLALVVLLGLAVGGYLVACSSRPVLALVPVLVLVIATVLFPVELLYWLGAVLGAESVALRVLAGAVLVAFPIATTTLIILLGRRTRAAAP